MKKVFSLALLFASVNNFFADGDISNEPVAESKTVVSDEQQKSVDKSSRFFLELGVNVGVKNCSLSNMTSERWNHGSYHFAFGGTIAPYYVLNDKYSIGLEFGINRSENFKMEDSERQDIKSDFTHYSYMLMLRRNICNNVYAKIGVGASNGSQVFVNTKNSQNILKMGPVAKVAVGYNVWKNIDVELGYNYYWRINGDVTIGNIKNQYKVTSHALSAGILVRL